MTEAEILISNERNNSRKAWEKEKNKGSWLKKVLYTTKTVVITLLVVAVVGMYLFLHAERVANQKTQELKDQQIQELQKQVNQTVNLK